MKKMFTMISIGIISLIMIGCSSTPITMAQLDINDSQERSRIECYKSLKEAQLERTKALSFIPKDQLALVLVLDSMQSNNLVMMGMATGKNYDPCGSGTNVFDVQIAEVNAKNGSLQSVTGGFVDIAKIGLAVWGATEIVDSISGASSGLAIAGDGNTVVSGSTLTNSMNNVSTTGEMSSLSLSNSTATTDTTTNTQDASTH